LGGFSGVFLKTNRGPPLPSLPFFVWGGVGGGGGGKCRDALFWFVFTLAARLANNLHKGIVSRTGGIGSNSTG
jgi:hypothetical protein